MEDLVFCKKYQEELPAMTFPPLPGEKGKELLH
jgi:Fe-S cluster biosynthesis and repair protein YggX